MSKDQHSAQDFDRIFQEKLGGHSVSPPAGMWETINANTQANKRKRGLLWIITNDSTIMLLILLLSIFSFAKSDYSASLSASENTTVITESVSSIPSESETENNNIEMRSELENADQSNRQDDLTENESELAESAYNDSNTHLDDALTKSNMDESSAESNRVSKQISSSSSNSGKTNPETNETSSESSSADLSKNEPVKEEELNTDDENESSLYASDSDSSDDELSGNESIRSFRKKSVEPRSSKNAFNWNLMQTIPPHLSIKLNDDSLSKVSVPTLPKDLVGSRNHEVFIGAHVNFNLPLIFNQNTYGAFDGKELAYKPTFGLASGVRLGYTFKRQYGFQTGFIFYSQQGQKYEDNLNGFAARRQVNLKYFHVPMVLRYKFKIKKTQKFESPWVINLGADVGILQSAEITYDGNEYPLGTISNPEANDKDYFKPIDVSVVLGVEKEIYFTKWLMLSIGMRTTFSSDINAEGHPVENDGKNYDKSHNFTFGFTLGLNYYLRR